MREDCINRLMERPRVSFPEEFLECAIGPRFDGCRARSLTRDPLGKPPQQLITERDLLQSRKVARIQLHRALQIAQTFLLLAAPPQNVAGEFS